MVLADLMTREVRVISPGATIQEAADQMANHDVGILPVCDANDDIVGVITDRDITIRATARGLDPNSTTVEDVMTRHVAACFQSDTLEEGARVMKEEQVRRLMVVDGEGKLAGILSVADIAAQTGDGEIIEEMIEMICHRGIPFYSTQPEKMPVVVK